MTILASYKFKLRFKENGGRTRYKSQAQ